MGNLKGVFEDVADWCEKHLQDEQGWEIGMTFGPCCGPMVGWQPFPHACPGPTVLPGGSGRPARE